MAQLYKVCLMLHTSSSYLIKLLIELPFCSHEPSSLRVLQQVMRLRQLKIQTTGIRSSMLLMR